MNNVDRPNRTRRKTLKTLALGAGTLAAPALMLKTAHALSRTVKIGFVTTNTLVFIGVGIVVLLILIAVLPRLLKKKKPKSDWD